MKVLVLIPTYNAYDKIIDVIKKLESIPEVDYLVIDRHSDDGTRKLLRNYGVKHLVYPIKVDYYKAMCLGIEYAHSNDYDAVIEYDDKNRFDHNTIMRLVRKYKERKPDIILTSRYKMRRLKNGRKEKGTQFLKFVTLCSTRKLITDPQNRYKLLGKNVIDFFATKKDYNEPTPDRIVQLISSNFSFEEIQTSLIGNQRSQKVNKGMKCMMENITWALSILFIQPFKRKAGK